MATRGRGGWNFGSAQEYTAGGLRRGSEVGTTGAEEEEDRQEEEETKFLKFHQYWPLVSRSCVVNCSVFTVKFCHHRPLLTNGSNYPTIQF